MCKAEVETLVALVLSSSKVVKSLILRHVAPDLVTFAVLPNIEELGHNEQKDVIRRDTE